MKLLITGISGFTGNCLVRSLRSRVEGLEIYGLDNLSRRGSETNVESLRQSGVRFFHGDVRQPSDLEMLPPVDWVIEAAANPSVLAGVDGRSSSRQLLEHNLLGTVNVLEYARRAQAGFLLLSTSRVYSIPALASIPVRESNGAFVADSSKAMPDGASEHGVSEAFSTAAPVSLYGATKLASETLALEYGATFGFPVWVNRCGVLAGAGQFGTAEQGIFSYWLHAHAARRPLRYIGFGGHGWQVRDAFHPDDLAELLAIQIRRGAPDGRAIHNAGGGIGNSMSLAQLTAWCDRRFGAFPPASDHTPRPFDIPWMVMDSRVANQEFGWAPRISLEAILEEIARHVHENPGWLEKCL
ncbi:MAG TPA: NAD-dependent epimerase/dehydratase family protein [Verrucomicrobiae bacterium]|nr:NAD-dependent epimerase/dehydratase family protein [Verrucomicrobiae bacterium]